MEFMDWFCKATSTNKTIKYFYLTDPDDIESTGDWIDEKVIEARWLLAVRDRLTEMGLNWKTWDANTYFSNGGLPVELNGLSDDDLLKLLQSKATPKRFLRFDYDWQEYNSPEGIAKLKKILRENESKIYSLGTCFDEVKISFLLKQGFTENDARVVVEYDKLNFRCLQATKKYL